MVAILFLSGCATGPAGSTWWNPGTWFSHHAAASVDSAAVKVDKKEDAAVKAAQTEVVKTGEALEAAPPSREVELAKRFNGNAETLLAQATGPLSLGDSAALKALVRDLRSETAATREKAEKAQKKAEESLSELSADLQEAQGKLAKAETNLRAAFERENALANKYRNIRFVAVGAVVLSLVLGGLWLYVRYSVGGLPAAVGRMLADAQGKSPQLAGDIRSLLDAVTNRHEQAAISAEYVKTVTK